jgi:hypothetical protein
LHASLRYCQSVDRRVQRLLRPNPAVDLRLGPLQFRIRERQIRAGFHHRVHGREVLLELRVGRRERGELQLAQFGIERRPRLFHREPVLGGVEFEKRFAGADAVADVLEHAEHLPAHLRRERHVLVGVERADDRHRAAQRSLLRIGDRDRHGLGLVGLAGGAGLGRAAEGRQGDKEKGRQGEKTPRPPAHTE